MVPPDPTATTPTDPATDPLAPADSESIRDEDSIETEAPAEAEPEPTPPPRAEPVASGERLAAVDVLRGVALLGILAMNVVSFAWPFSGYDNPDLSGGSSTLNRSLWMFNHVLFSGKMMSLFSMLFGAGLVLMADRAAARGASVRGVYYRRVLWLLAIGLVHAYLIWTGDILVPYALCGLVLFLFRDWKPKTLVISGAVLIVISTAVFPLMGLGLNFVRQTAESAAAEQAAGGSPETWRVEMIDTWAEVRSMFQPTEEKFAEQLDQYRGSYLEVLPHRARETFAFHAFFLPLFIWTIAGRMLLGMGLMKLGVFSAERSRTFYLKMAAIAYGVGLPLTILGGLDMWRTDFDPIRSFLVGSSLSLLAAVPVALGHAAVVMLVVQSGALSGLTRRLAAAGRMALTNYLVQSVVGTLIFYGYGLGYFGQVDRLGLWLIVLAIWAAQLWYSPIWLARFRFGPAEWVWRSLTYGKAQPLRA